MFRITKLTIFAYASLLLIVIAALLMPHLVVKYDEAAHISAYAAVMIWPATVIVSTRRALLVALLVITIGGVIEYLQRFSPERTPSWADFNMNVVGVVVGLLIGLTFKRIRRWAQT